MSTHRQASNERTVSGADQDALLLAKSVIDALGTYMKVRLNGDERWNPRAIREKCSLRRCQKFRLQDSPFCRLHCSPDEMRRLKGLSAYRFRKISRARDEMLHADAVSAKKMPRGVAIHVGLCHQSRDMALIDFLDLLRKGGRGPTEAETDEICDEIRQGKVPRWPR